MAGAFIVVMLSCPRIMQPLVCRRNDLFCAHIAIWARTLFGQIHAFHGVAPDQRLAQHAVVLFLRVSVAKSARIVDRIPGQHAQLVRLDQHL